jgi:hypothetical protein
MNILLDIDGVMLPAATWKSPQNLSDGFPAFENSAVKSLNRILEKSNPTIVLTTSHRNRFNTQEWKQIFSARGVFANVQVCSIPYETRQSRYELIMTWVSENNSSNDFVIIDDDKSLNQLPANLKSHLFLTSPLIGLDNSIAEKVIEKLVSYNN